MYYKINLKKLQKIIADNHTWEEDGAYTVSSVKSPINPELLKSLSRLSVDLSSLKSFVELAKVGVSHKVSTQENVLRLAAEMSINKTPQKELIEINLGDQNGLPEKLFKNWNSVAQYLSCSYLKEEFVVCKVNGEESVIKGLLGKSAEKLEDFNFITDFRKNITEISWVVSKEILAQSWGSEDYVLNELSKNMSKEKVFNLAPEKVLKSKSFWIGVANSCPKALKELPQGILKNSDFIDFVFSDTKILSLFWEDYIKKIQEVRSLLSIEFKVSSTAGLEKLNELTEEKLGSKHLFVKKLFNVVLSDKEKVIDLLKNGNCFDSNSCSCISSELRMDKEVIDNIYALLIKDRYSRKDFSELIPSEFFTSKEKTINFLNQYAPSIFGNYGNFPDYIKTHFENDIDSVKLLLTATAKVTDSNGAIKRVKDNVSEDIIKSKDFLKKLIEIQDRSIVENKSYMNLIKKSKELQDYALEVKNYNLFNALPEEIIYDVKNKVDIIELVKINYNLLKKAPEWLKDIDIVCAIGKNLHWLNLNKSQIKELVNGEVENAKKIINCGIDNYLKLPKESRQSIEVGKHFLNKIDNESDSEKLRNIAMLDSYLWASYEFCNYALEQDISYAKSIPLSYWNRPEFIRSVFEKIDEKIIAYQIITLMPTEIKQCLDSFKVESGELVKFVDKFFTQQILSNTLTEKEEVKPKKIKI